MRSTLRNPYTLIVSQVWGLAAALSGRSRFGNALGPRSLIRRDLPQLTLRFTGTAEEPVGFNPGRGPKISEAETLRTAALAIFLHCQYRKLVFSTPGGVDSLKNEKLF